MKTVEELRLELKEMIRIESEIEKKCYDPDMLTYIQGRLSALKEFKEKFSW